MKIYNKTPKWREREVYAAMNASPVTVLRRGKEPDRGCQSQSQEEPALAQEQSEDAQPNPGLRQ